MKTSADRSELFSNAPIPKAVATLAVPTVLSMLVTIVYNMADTFFVGQTGDPNQVAAVSLATPVFLLMMAIGNMFGVGGSSEISRALGAGKAGRVRHISSFCFYGSITAGLVMIPLFLLGMPVILFLIGASPDTYDFAREYLVYIAWGAPFVVLSSAFSNVIRGEGAAGPAMFGMMLGTVVNIVLDPIMILSMDMGVAGAAIATVIGNISSVAYYLLYLRGKSTILSVRPKDFQMGNRILFGVVTIGLPATITNILMSLSNVVLNNFLAHYGDTAIAAMGVAMKANMLVVFLQMGIAMGVQPLVGYNFGAHHFQRMRKAVFFALSCTLVIGLALTVIYFFHTARLVGFFIDDSQVIDAGVPMLRALMISGPFMGVLFVLNFSLQAMGKAVPSLILALSRQGLVFLPLLFILDGAFQLKGIIYAQPVADVFSVLLAIGLFFGITRKLKEAGEKEPEETTFQRAS